MGATSMASALVRVQLSAPNRRVPSRMLIGSPYPVPVKWCHNKQGQSAAVMDDAKACEVIQPGRGGHLTSRKDGNHHACGLAAQPSASRSGASGGATVRLSGSAV